MCELSLDARVLGLHLGLGDLGESGEVCHGYAHACVCTDCLARAEQPPAPEPVPQPWDQKAARSRIAA